jgi:hypothetical protein
VEVLLKIRRQNLKELVRIHGNGNVARAAGYSSPSYLSQMIGNKSKRPITEATARKIELAYSLEPNWLDKERNCDKESVGKVEVPLAMSNVKAPLAMSDADRFSHCAEIINNVIGELGINISHLKFANILWLVLEKNSDDDNAASTYVKNLIRLAI